MAPSPLPDPVMRFSPPRENWHMEFMLLGGPHNKVLATDQTGRAVLYDPDQHTVRTLRSAQERARRPHPRRGRRPLRLRHEPDAGQRGPVLRAPRARPGRDEDWYPRVLPPPPPYRYDGTDQAGQDGPRPNADSYAASADGSRVWISGERGVGGTYAFDTAAEAWSKAGGWKLPFTGLAEYVPEHGVWFGLGRCTDDRCVFCAVDLASGSVRRAPAVRDLGDLDPVPTAAAAKWMVHFRSQLVHLGSARFSVDRLFTTDRFAPGAGYPVTHAVFTAVEVERCADADGGLRMVKHGSKMSTLLHEMTYWVL